MSKLNKIVVDFVKDMSNTLWFLGVKSFQLEDIKIETQIVETSEEMKQKMSKAILKLSKVNICRICKQSYTIESRGDSFRLSDVYELKKIMASKNFINRILDSLVFTQEELETKDGVEVIEKEILKTTYNKGTQKDAEIQEKTSVEYPEITFCRNCSMIIEKELSYYQVEGLYNKLL